MEQVFAFEKVFDKIDFTENPLPGGEYETCKFHDCDFSNTNLSNIKFEDCTFNGCNLSLCILHNTAWRNAQFTDCKMLGLHFENCNPFGLALDFDSCNLNHSSFYQRKLKNIKFRNGKLHEVDFTECDLSNSVFDNCDLAGATFQNTLLMKADFRTSHNYAIHPENNRIKKARFSLSGVAGLLHWYDVIIE